jgi:hypothetical protein
MDVEELRLSLAMDVEEPYLVGLYGITGHEIGKINALGKDAVAFEITAEAEGDIEFSLPKGDLYSLSDERFASLSTTELNKWYVSSSATIELNLTCEGVFRTDTKKIEKMKLLNADPRSDFPRDF